MPTTYEILASQTISTGVNTITLSSIPQGYTDLRLVLTSRVSSGSSNPSTTFNNDTGSNYTRIVIWSTGSNYGAQTNFSQAGISTPYAADSGTGAFAITTFDIFDYANTNHEKGLLLQQSASNGSSTLTVQRGCALWNSKAAINRIDINNGATWNTGTVVALYGILKA